MTSAHTQEVERLIIDYMDVCSRTDPNAKAPTSGIRESALEILLLYLLSDVQSLIVFANHTGSTESIAS